MLIFLNVDIFNLVYIHRNNYECNDIKIIVILFR